MLQSPQTEFEACFMKRKCGPCFAIYIYIYIYVIPLSTAKPKEIAQHEINANKNNSKTPKTVTHRTLFLLAIQGAANFRGGLPATYELQNIVCDPGRAAELRLPNHTSGESNLETP